MKHFFIDLLAFATLLSSVLVITSKNPVISVIFLISVFVNAAGYLIVLGLGFIGISYIIVYIGAIAVLFLFVIMMINIKLTDILETGSQYTKNIPLALGIGSLFIYEIFTILPFSFNNVSGLSALFNFFSSFNGLLFSYETSNINLINTAYNPAIADVTFKLKETTPFVVLDSARHERYKKEGFKTQIPFSLYDDGWRVEKKPGLNFVF